MIVSVKAPALHAPALHALSCTRLPFGIGPRKSMEALITVCDTFPCNSWRCDASYLVTYLGMKPLVIL
jgi:hypothetical protein